MQQRTIFGASNTSGEERMIRVHAEPCQTKDRGEERMIRVHAEPCQTKGIHFVPLIAETTGGWSDQAITNITQIGHFLGQRLGSSESEAIRLLFQQLAITLWRGNASLWIHRQTALSAQTDGLK